MFIRVKHVPQVLWEFNMATFTWQNCVIAFSVRNVICFSEAWPPAGCKSTDVNSGVFLFLSSIFSGLCQPGIHTLPAWRNTYLTLPEENRDPHVQSTCLRSTKNTQVLCGEFGHLKQRFTASWERVVPRTTFHGTCSLILASFPPQDLSSEVRWRMLRTGLHEYNINIFCGLITLPHPYHARDFRIHFHCVSQCKIRKYQCNLV